MDEWYNRMFPSENLKDREVGESVDQGLAN